jgi:alpha-L-glutamate ligase-like protein
VKATGRELQALRDRGVLGINRRNAEYTLRCNPRHLYPRVDDKLTTKRLCQEVGIPVPELLGFASHHFEIRALLERVEELASFVLKPSRGAMGNGILVILEREGDRFLRPGGHWVGRDDLRYHAASIISGLYSLAGQPDSALLEERLEVHPDLRAIAFEGVPDIRLVVYRGVPVMSMMRLPTRASGGRANLHQGAIGAGIDLATGCTTHAVHRNHPVRYHIDSNKPVIGVSIPDFDQVLEIATHAADQTGLGYVGADVVVDAVRGPVVLELNARPGLAIQNANLAGLLPRLRAVDRVPLDLSLAERIAVGREIAARNQGARPSGSGSSLVSHEPASDA